MPKYAIWAMMKNKEPEFFIKQFKGIFKKIITIPIENEQNCMSANDLKTIAKKNQFNVIKANSFSEAINYITSSEKKLISCIGSLFFIIAHMAYLGALMFLKKSAKFLASVSA